jgi:transcriptional regulator GlxA family with amidase domain
MDDLRRRGKAEGASGLRHFGWFRRDRKQATSHHEFIGEFRKAFPNVQWQASRRYVRSDEHTYTAAGLTSGIDLALHLVAVRFGTEVAQRTADYMEYHGDGWKQTD